MSAFAAAQVLQCFGVPALEYQPAINLWRSMHKPMRDTGCDNQGVALPAPAARLGPPCVSCGFWPRAASVE